MARKAHLSNIAAGLCGSFASRNNDAGGYWVIGKLRVLAEQHAQNRASIDVLAPSIQPASSEFAQVLADYHRLVKKLASRTGIRLEDITTATITVDFLPRPWHRTSYYQQHWGEQFLLTVTIRAEGRADGIVSHGGYCRPHDPDKERCRSAP